MEVNLTDENVGRDLPISSNNLQTGLSVAKFMIIRRGLYWSWNWIIDNLDESSYGFVADY
jgi:hypothetical protein